MHNVSEEFKTAIVGDSRQTKTRMVLDISDPDIVYSDVSSNVELFPVGEQLRDREFETDENYITLEENRWLLNGNYTLTPQGDTGFVSLDVADKNGNIDCWVSLNFSNVTVLQFASVYFAEGYAVDFVIDVMSNGVALYSKAFTDNTQTHIDISGFIVNQPDAIKVTITKWNTPNNRARIAEIVAGFYANWDENKLVSFSVNQQMDFSGITLPYSTANVSLDNSDGFFNPLDKGSIFNMLEEKQPINLEIGVKTGNKFEFVDIGTYYLYGTGWKTTRQNLSFDLSLTSIIGLITSRKYIVPNTLPTTLEGWVQSILSVLGEGFENLYEIREDKGTTTATTTKEKIENISCGDLLRYVAMACGCYVRSEKRLIIEPLRNDGTEITIDNQNQVPTLSANSDLADITFTYDAGTIAVAGNSTKSDVSLNVNNPFLHTESDVLNASKIILANYGGKRIEATYRGNPASELGDVSTVEVTNNYALNGRVVKQTFNLQDGVLQRCGMTLVASTGYLDFKYVEEVKISGTYTVPDDVSTIRIVLIGKGSKGEKGKNWSSEWSKLGDGYWLENGAGGVGGKVFSETFNVNPNQTFSVEIGEETTFGQFTSADGKSVQNGYIDTVTGKTYARTGINNPIANSGDGGAGGKGAYTGFKREDEWLIDPIDAEEGQEGAIGLALVYYNKGSES